MVIFHSYVSLPEGRSSKVLHNVEVLWMVAKSESPVENGGLHILLFWMGFNHPFGGAGFRWPIHSIDQDSMLPIKVMDILRNSQALIMIFL